MALPQFPTPAIAWPLSAPNPPPLPLASLSQWESYPTGVSADLLSGSPDPDAQLTNILANASELVNLEIFGAGQRAPGTRYQLQASVVTQTERVAPIEQELRLRCRVVPVLSVLGVSQILGSGPVLISNGAQTWIDGSVLFVPLGTGFGFPVANNPGGYVAAPNFASGMTLNIAWQYVAGYFHSSLSAGVAAGATSIDVTPNASSGLVGLYPGMSLRIGQTTQTQESVVVKSVNGTTITLVDPVQNAYVIPSAPDFIAVTAVPLVLVEAAIYVAAAILINSGQSAVVLSPSGSSGSSSLDDDVEAMLDQARYRIAPYQRILA